MGGNKWSSKPGTQGEGRESILKITVQNAFDLSSSNSCLSWKKTQAREGPCVWFLATDSFSSKYLYCVTVSAIFTENWFGRPQVFLICDMEERRKVGGAERREGKRKERWEGVESPPYAWPNYG